MNRKIDLNENPHGFAHRPMAGIAEANADGQLTVLHSADLSKLCGGKYSHDQVAVQVRMLMRDQLDHEAVCTMGRDRIKWLAHREEVLRAEVHTLQQLLKGARCPEPNCDNAGTITATGHGGEPEPQQCEWCYYRTLALNPAGGG